VYPLEKVCDRAVLELT